MGAQMKHGWLGIVLVLGLLMLAGPAGVVGVGGQSIRLLYASFDPLVEGEPAVALHLRAAPGSPYGLLQLTGPAQAAWVNELAALGVAFYGYAPEHSYVVRLAPGSEAAVAAHAAVRWLGPLHPAYKLSPSLSGGRLLLQLFPDADVMSAAAAVTAVGASVQEINATARLLIVEATAALLPALANIPDVYWVQNATPAQELNDDARWVTQSGTLQVTSLYDRGLSGAGQVGGVADSGLAVYDFTGDTPEAASCYFVDDGNGGSGGVARLPGPDHRKVVGYVAPPGAQGDLVDGSGHGSHVVGTIAGNRAPWNAPATADGHAYAARIFFQDIGTGDLVGFINPPSDYRLLFGQAYDPDGDGRYQPALEARTHSNSWGAPDPIYSAESGQTDDFMWQHPDFLILFAAGNQGPGPSSVGYPANAKNVVSVGGTENGLADSNSMGYFSSHGPGPLGRLEPTVSAPGDRITSALRGDACGTAERSGTSMATPAVHGVALLMRQYLWDGYYPLGEANAADRRHPSAALLKALLMSSGRPMSGAHSDNALGGSWPANGQGWGRVTAGDSLYFQGDRRALWLHDEYSLDGSAGFDAAGQSRTFTFTLSDGRPFATQPLRIVLAWTDYAGEPLAGGALVNDLNLTVSGPGGAVYRGNDAGSNDFQGLPDLPPAPDNINPWEVVYLSQPVPGVYTVTVSAASLGSLALDPGRKQGFALVVTGDLLSQQGRAAFEYPVYDVAPKASARLRLSDLGLNTRPATIETAQVTVSSSNGRSVKVTLTETGPDSGIFSGQVTLATGQAGKGELLVAAGDELLLIYKDQDNGRGSTAGPGKSKGGPTTVYGVARVGATPLNFSNPPGLNPAGPSLNGRFSLTWSAAEDTNGLSHYILQESRDHTVLLFDDAEGSISAYWHTGQFNAPWLPATLYRQSGLLSYWSGRGDTGVLIDTSLTLKDDIPLPASLAAAWFSFYSRYYNDFNDYGHVEISADGGVTWSPLRRLYADPRLVPAHTRLQYHQFDLSPYLGQQVRVRFRYDNGVLSFAPDSPGWWLDDISISGGSWQTIATPAGRTHEVSGKAAGRYYFRVQGLYADGSASGWSNVVGVDVLATPLAP